MAMKGMDELVVALRAGYPYYYCKTYEISRSIENIQLAVKTFNEEFGGDEPWQVLVWDLEKDQDPEKVLENMEKAPADSIIVAKNFNWFFQNEYGTPEYRYVTYFQNRTELFASQEQRKSLVILGNEDFEKAVPASLIKDFLSLEFGLPTEDEISVIYEDLLDGVRDDPKFIEPDKKTRKKIIDASKGMSALAVKNALAFSLIKDGGTIVPKTVGLLRAQEVEKTPGLTISDYDQGFDTLLGYDNLKDLFLNTYENPLSHGLILVGHAGTGKTHFAKAAGFETGIPVFMLEMAQTMGDGLVGQAEKALGEVIEVVTVNAPCVLLIDEIEKGLSGVSKSAGGDSTAKRSQAQLLKFLSDERPPGVYVLATCNDINGLPPEWWRVGRWDAAPIFVGLPNKKEQKSILEYYKKTGFTKNGQTWYSTGKSPKDMQGWSGAEITASCKLSAIMGRPLEDTDRFIIPQSSSAKERFTELEAWAKNNCIPATALVDTASTGRGKVTRRVKL